MKTHSELPPLGDLIELLLEIKVDLKEVKKKIEQKNVIVPDEYGYFTGRQVEQLLQVDEMTLARYRESGDIKAKRFAHGAYKYPKKQFLNS